MFFILPFAEIIFDSRKYQQFALMMENEENLKKLISRMDELDAELSRDRRVEAKLKRARRRAQIKQFMNKLIKSKKKNAE